MLKPYPNLPRGSWSIHRKWLKVGGSLLGLRMFTVLLNRNFRLMWWIGTPSNEFGTPGMRESVFATEVSNSAPSNGHIHIRGKPFGQPADGLKCNKKRLELVGSSNTCLFSIPTNGMMMRRMMRTMLLLLLLLLTTTPNWLSLCLSHQLRNPCHTHALDIYTYIIYTQI